MIFGNSKVQVLDGETFSVLFQDPTIMRVGVTEAQTPTKFQVETGETRNDHVIEEAIEVVVYFNLLSESARDQFAAIREAKDANRLVTIQTKMSSYDNMLIESIGLDESAYVYSGAEVPVTFSEWREVSPEYGDLKQEQVAEPKQASTKKSGKQSGTTTPPQQERKASVLYGILN